MSIAYFGDVVMSGGTEESPPNPTRCIPKEKTDMISTPAITAITTRAPRLLAPFIVALALADGVLHLALDFVLFHGAFWGSGSPAGPPSGGGPGSGAPGPAPGAPANPLLLPLNELFLLNFLGYVGLVLVFWLAPRWLGQWRWVVDAALMGYAALGIVAWLEVGRPNPLGLGYLSKGLEIALILAVAAHARMVLGTRAVAGRTA
jgi:hypothetical protein